MMLIIIGALDVDPFNNLRGLLVAVLRPRPQVFFVLVPLKPFVVILVVDSEEVVVEGLRGSFVDLLRAFAPIWSRRRSRRHLRACKGRSD